MDNKNNHADNEEKKERAEGSKSDPQKTEMAGLKQGGKDPIVHSEDKPLDREGKQDK